MTERLARERNEALAIAKERAEYADECRREAERQGSRAVKAEAERDELAATVERVQALADAMERDHAKDDASSGGWFFATEAAIEGLRDALNGGESDE